MYTEPQSLGHVTHSAISRLRNQGVAKITRKNNTKLLNSCLCENKNQPTLHPFGVTLPDTAEDSLPLTPAVLSHLSPHAAWESHSVITHSNC